MEGASSPGFSGLFIPGEDAVVPSRLIAKRFGMLSADGINNLPSTGLPALSSQPTYHPFPPLPTKNDLAGIAAEIVAPLAYQQVPQLHSYQLPSVVNPQQPVPPPAPHTVPSISTGRQRRLTSSERGELELAKQRAERASSNKKAKVNKRPIESDEDSDHLSDLDISRLPPDEQEAAINAKLATVDNEKDAKRLKRLLRNRISAQQARERKKQYVTTLEDQIKAQQTLVKELEGKLRNAENQNAVLRRIIQSMKAAPSSPLTSGFEAGPVEVQQESGSGLLPIDGTTNCSC